MNDNDVLCPYCRNGLGDMIDTVTVRGKPVKALAILCIHCGEPLMYENKPSKTVDFTLRKPSDDELIMLHENTSLRAARAAWLLAKDRSKQNRPPIMEETWRVYRRTVLRNEHDEDFIAKHKKTYFAGAIAMSSVLKHASTLDDEDEFSALTSLVDAELHAISIEIPQPQGKQND